VTVSRAAPTSLKAFQSIRTASAQAQQPSFDVYNPQYISNTKANNIISGVASPQIIDYIEKSAASLGRVFDYDSASQLIAKREDTVNIRLSNSVESVEGAKETKPFLGKVTLGLVRNGKQSYSEGKLI